jgi:hypothetical protein
MTPTPEPDCLLPCTGDCNGDCTVVINELILMVNLALSGDAPSACSAADPDGDGAVAINEIVTGVNRALNGCPRGPA